jgi:hypothetical protein
MTMTVRKSSVCGRFRDKNLTSKNEGVATLDRRRFLGKCATTLPMALQKAQGAGQSAVTQSLPGNHSPAIRKRGAIYRIIRR